MKRILILDTETSGTDATKDHIVEVAAILYDLEHACSVESWSSLVCAPSNAAESINRIPVGVLAELGEEFKLGEVMDNLRAAAAWAGAIVAYSAEFDRAFVEIANGGPLLQERAFGEDEAPPIPWVCAMNDLEWPKASGGGRSLVALALGHDLGVSHAHRALTDCDLLARLFGRARELGADLPSMLRRGLRPKVRVIARVSYAERDKAKAAGFQWDGKVWARLMPAEDAASLPFPSIVVGDASGAYQAALPLGDKAAP